MKSHFLVIGCCALAAANPALAQQRPAAPTAPAIAAPVQQAGAPLQRAEFIVTMDSEFSKMDADKDGFLTRKEIEDYQRIVAMTASRQLNQNLFAQLDSDRNGQISPAEFLALPMNVPPANANVILGFDSNRDGKVSKIENRAGTLTNFDRADTDKDGIVTAAELKAAGIR